MKLSTIFFILTPFGFFCTENGTGLITGTVFLIIGLVCKMYENGTFDDIGKQKVSPEEFWKIHFYNRMFNKNYPNYVSDSTPDDARKWADYICECHGAPVPSDARFEEIAKSLGVVTEKAKKDIREHGDRVQIGK